LASGMRISLRLIKNLFIHGMKFNFILAITSLRSMGYLQDEK
jgi:hypothetical protein